MWVNDHDVVIASHSQCYVGGGAWADVERGWYYSKPCWTYFHSNGWTKWPLTFIFCICADHDRLGLSLLGRSRSEVKVKCQKSRSNVKMRSVNSPSEGNYGTFGPHIGLHYAPISVKFGGGRANTILWQVQFIENFIFTRYTGRNEKSTSEWIKWR